MLALPNPLRNPLVRESRPLKPTPPQLADLLARLERKAARRERLISGAAASAPARWFRPDLRTGRMTIYLVLPSMSVRLSPWWGRRLGRLQASVSHFGYRAVQAVRRCFKRRKAPC